MVVYLKILATRSKNVGLLYTFGLLIGIFTMLFVFLHLFFLLAGMLITVIAVIILLQYHKVHPTPILLNEDNVIIINNNLHIKLNDIIDVSYTRANGRQIHYKWGDVTIRTHNKIYKIDYINDCEKVSKELNELIYKSK